MIPGSSKFNPTVQRSHSDIQIPSVKDHQHTWHMSESVWVVKWWFTPQPIIQVTPSQRPPGSHSATQRSRIYLAYMVDTTRAKSRRLVPSNTPPNNAGLSPGRSPWWKRPSRTHRCKVSADGHLRSYRVPGRITSSGHSAARVANCCALIGTARSPRVGSVISHLDESAEGLILTTCL